MSDEKQFSASGLLDTLISNALGLTVLATLLITNLGVLMRYVFEISMPWNEEVVRFLFVWMVFIGFAQAYRTGGLAGILFLEEALYNRGLIGGYNGVRRLQGLINVGFGFFGMLAGFEIMQIQMETEEITTVVEIPLYLITLGFTMGFTLFTAYALGSFVRMLRSKPVRESAPPPHD